MRRGEVYWAPLSPRSGSEQAGRRPVIVVSRDAFNQAPGWRSIIVVPLSTSAAQSRRGPTAVALPANAGGFAHESVALCHQVTTLDRDKLGELHKTRNLAESGDGAGAAQAIDRTLAELDDTQLVSIDEAARLAISRGRRSLHSPW